VRSHWKVTRGADGVFGKSHARFAIKTEKNGDDSARFICATEGDTPLSIKQAEDAAYLIAAAPEMLEGLKFALKALERVGTAEGDEDVLDYLHCAIMKAEGRNN
jgi:hypothetical protein